MNAEAISCIVFAANSILPRACKLDGRDRKGGYLCVAEPDGKIVLVMLIGEVPDLEKANLFKTFCQEKATRLAQNPEHISSWQTRDVEKKQYGGAVRTGKGYIYSFSGFTEEVDESFSARVAFQNWDDMSIEHRTKIAGISGNRYLIEIHQLPKNL
ncbi:MAG: hypothetical protein WC631_03635 [Candidatus Paceibacterota bacterium]|jgi:hypothetical protein